MFALIFSFQRFESNFFLHVPVAVNFDRLPFWRSLSGFQKNMFRAEPVGRVPSSSQHNYSSITYLLHDSSHQYNSTQSWLREKLTLSDFALYVNERAYLTMWWHCRLISISVSHVIFQPTFTLCHSVQRLCSFIAITSKKRRHQGKFASRSGYFLATVIAFSDGKSGTGILHSASSIKAFFASLT